MREEQAATVWRSSWQNKKLTKTHSTKLQEAEETNFSSFLIKLHFVRLIKRYSTVELLLSVHWECHLFGVEWRGNVFSISNTHFSLFSGNVELWIVWKISAFELSIVPIMSTVRTRPLLKIRMPSEISTLSIQSRVESQSTRQRDGFRCLVFQIKSEFHRCFIYVTQHLLKANSFVGIWNR